MRYIFVVFLWNFHRRNFLVNPDDASIFPICLSKNANWDETVLQLNGLNGSLLFEFQSIRYREHRLLSRWQRSKLSEIRLWMLQHFNDDSFVCPLNDLFNISFVNFSSNHRRHSQWAQISVQINPSIAIIDFSAQHSSTRHVIDTFWFESFGTYSSHIVAA